MLMTFNILAMLRAVSKKRLNATGRSPILNFWGAVSFLMKKKTLL